MKYKTLIWIIVAVVAVAAVWLFFSRKDSSLDYGTASPAASGNGSGAQGGSIGGTGSSNAGSNGNTGSSNGGGIGSTGSGNGGSGLNRDAITRISTQAGRLPDDVEKRESPFVEARRSAR